jgi:hypothetical protein
MYVVPGVSLIPQKDAMSCWYASAQMLIQWKASQAQMSSNSLVPPELDKECRKIRDAGGGLVNSEMLAMAKRLGLQAVPPMTPNARNLLAWLQAYGPLWVNGKDHIVVLAGINETDLLVFDPWPVNAGMVTWRSIKGWYIGGANPNGQPDSSRDAGQGVQAVFLHCP